MILLRALTDIDMVSTNLDQPRFRSFLVVDRCRREISTTTRPGHAVSCDGANALATVFNELPDNVALSAQY